jgi:two-component system OmpR family response regulator
MASNAVADPSFCKLQRGSKSRILIVVDDAAFATLIKSYLARDGYGVSAVRTVAAMCAAIEAGEIDLIILDTMLPDGDGWSALRWIRARGEMPVLMLTGERETIDKMIGLGLVADGYLPKPLDLRELPARLRRIEQRAEPLPPDAEPGAGGVLKFPGWVLDTTSQQLATETGQRVHLTQMEYRILLLLVRNPRRTVTRDQLMAAAAGRDWEPLDRNIDVHISNLRRKLDVDPKMPSLIRAVRGAGYMFVPSHAS